MPRKAKTTEPETKTAQAAPEAPRGAKTQAVRDVLKANPRKEPKEIIALLKEQGIEVSSNYVSGIKFQMNKKKGGRKKTAPAPAPEATAPALPKDAVSVGLLQKAKKLAAQLGGIKEAKAAIDALAQILD